MVQRKQAPTLETPQGEGAAKLEKTSNLAPAAHEMLVKVFQTPAYQNFIASIAPECNRLENGRATEIDKAKVLSAIDAQLASSHENFPGAEDSANNILYKLKAKYQAIETVDGNIKS